MQRQRGFTLLELIIVLAILGVVTAAVSTGMDDWSSRKTYQNAYKQLYNELSLAKNRSSSQSTTTRVLLTQAGTTYTYTSFISSTPTTTCDATGTWTQMANLTLDVPSTYQVTGTGLNNHICFYRDGTASSATYLMSPIDATSGLQTATIIVTIATGYLDVTVN